MHEFIFFNARRDQETHFESDALHWRGVYNTLRPHEALGDRPPVEFWRPSERKRPATLPEPVYQPGHITRKITGCGEISFRGFTILVGRGLAGETVRVDERDGELAVLYCDHQVRSLRTEHLVKGRML